MGIVGIRAGLVEATPDRMGTVCCFRLGMLDLMIGTVVSMMAGVGCCTGVGESFCLSNGRVVDSGG